MSDHQPDIETTSFPTNRNAPTSFKFILMENVGCSLRKRCYYDRLIVLVGITLEIVIIYL